MQKFLFLTITFSINILYSQETKTTEKPATQLETVEIKTEKSTIEHKGDKKIFNVGSDLISKGGSALDILNNVPSVTVNADGAINLRGKSGVRILINGKPSVLTANNGLEQIPSESIEKIEVITNPSSRYDAEGTAGIINIILKKNKKIGFSSSVQVRTGIPENSALGYNVSFKNKKINLFSDMRYQKIFRERNETTTRTNFANNFPTDYLLGDINLDRNNKTFNAYFGGDYYINDKNTLTLSYYYRNNTSNNTSSIDYDYLDGFKNKTQAIQSVLKYREPQIANQIELNYVKNFDKENKKFTLNLQYDFWNDDENEDITENRNIANSTTQKLIRSRDIESSKDFLFQTDFTNAITEKAKIEVGLKTEIRAIDSDYEVFENNIQNANMTNILHYKEQIFGAYLQYGNSIKKLQYLLGIRTEYSKTGSNDQKNLFNINKEYLNLFPTANFTYEVNEATSLQLSYSKRISRPGFWQLNPFGGIADSRVVRIGNPDLNPVFTDSYELGTLIKWKQWTINPSLYHQYSKNIFENINYYNAAETLIEQSVNLGNESRLGAEISINYSPLKWLTFSGEMNYYNFKQEGLFTVSDNAFTSRLNTKVKHKTWNFQTSYNFQGARKSGQLDSKSVSVVDVAFGKDIWNEKATITLKAENLFNSQVFRGAVNGSNYKIDYAIENVGPRVFATFTYRFNRKKTDRERTAE
jgi:outer membrane receptor protein involved in Fe transport